MIKIDLCILTYNEFENLKENKSSILDCINKNNFYDVFFIDNNSTDGTQKLINDLSIKLISQEKKGRGSAIIQAIKYSKADYLILYSPDGNENINDISTFIKLINKNIYDLIIASRMMKDAFNEEDINFFKPRKIANNFFNFLINFSFNKKNYVTDSINGYRALKLKKIKNLNLDSERFTIEYQMTLRSMKEGLNIYEFPTIEGQRLHGQTKASSFRVGLEFINCFIRELFKK